MKFEDVRVGMLVVFEGRVISPVMEVGNHTRPYPTVFPIILGGTHNAGKPFWLPASHFVPAPESCKLGDVVDTREGGKQ